VSVSGTMAPPSPPPAAPTSPKLPVELRAENSSEASPPFS